MGAMNNILPFHTHRASPANQQDETAFNLSAMSDGAVDFTSNQSTFPRSNEPASVISGIAKLRDWSNQDLASFMRAKRLLSMAGMSLETDRGMTDEGDPWFVFLDRDGKVFAHFARINGIFILDSIAQHEVIEAFSLEGLVAAFSRKSAPVQQDTDADSTAKVIALAGVQRAKVRVHPGAALAALVWTVYVSSDELAVPLVDKLTKEAPLKETSPEVVSSVDTLSPQAAISSDVLNVEPKEHNNTQVHFRKGLGQLSEMNSHTAPTQAAFQLVGLSLTAIAISNGFFSWSTGEQLVEDARDATKSLVTLVSSLPEGTEEQRADLTELGASLATAQTVLQEELGGKEHVDHKTTIDPNALSFADDGNQTTLEISISKSALVQETTPRIKVLTPDETLSESRKTESGRAVDTADTEQSVIIEKDFVLEALNGLNTLSFDSDEFTQVTEQLGRPQIIQWIRDPFAEVRDSNVVTLSGTVGTLLDSTSISLEREAPRFMLFNSEAHNFIVFLLTKGDETRRSDYSNEVILVDLDAFDGQGDVIYSRSWSFDDGSVVSAVGLKSDFEAFDLIV